MNMCVYVNTEIICVRRSNIREKPEQKTDSHFGCGSRIDRRSHHHILFKKIRTDSYYHEDTAYRGYGISGGERQGKAGKRGSAPEGRQRPEYRRRQLCISRARRIQDNNSERRQPGRVQQARKKAGPVTHRRQHVRGCTEEAGIRRDLQHTHELHDRGNKRHICTRGEQGRSREHHRYRRNRPRDRNEQRDRRVKGDRCTGRKDHNSLSLQQQGRRLHHVRADRCKL